MKKIKDVSFPAISRPLVIDLDGTLIKTDLLYETANSLLISTPLKGIIKLLYWLCLGIPQLKERLSNEIILDPSLLPYNSEVIEWIQEQRAHGRKIILATASHKKLADQIAKYLDIFDLVLATDGSINLKSNAKCKMLIERFGEKGFDYLGNSKSDLIIWRHAYHAYVVNPSPYLLRKAESLNDLVTVFSLKCKPNWQNLINALRPHQWVKNLLIFIPLIATYQINNHEEFKDSIFAFLAFCLTSSSMYLINDLVDIWDDRNHDRKKNRPFASGNLSIPIGWLIFPALIFTSIAISAVFLPHNFLTYLALYIALTLIYTFKIKEIIIADVLMLALLYTMRILAGADAITELLSI